MELLTTSDVARLLEVSPDMVRFYERTGRLPAVRTASGVRLFQRDDVERFVEARAKSKKAINDARLAGSSTGR